MNITSYMNRGFITVLIFIIAYSYSSNRFYSLLPAALPLYPDSYDEAQLVYHLALSRDHRQEARFHHTDNSVSIAFKTLLPDVPLREIQTIATQPNPIILLLKYIFNRPRPAQLNANIKHVLLNSATANTPSYPSGHSYQAFYLAKHYARRFPLLKQSLYHLAEQCGEARIIAGLHYPSDHAFSRWLVQNVHY